MSHSFSMRAVAASLLLGLASAAGAGAIQNAGQSGGSKDGSGAGISEYRIGPGDILRIDIWKEPDASMAAAVVRFDGKLSMPLIGQVDANGLSPVELQILLAEKYSSIIRDPRVTVMVTTPNNLKVYVLGEVRREGSLRLQAPLTVLQALAESGGLTDYAKRGNIYILRMQNNRQVRLPFDYNAVLKGRKSEQNVILLPGDTVVVPR
ncbi:MAG TPA: polysaccharide biosynthesis/export family protein [Bryobacteraceae bacterium]|nr:polysaccharide biosynthesis/export family protein [Bryobacteraceae bacterium]